MLRIVFNMKSVPGFFVVASTLLFRTADAVAPSLSVPTSSAGAIHALVSKSDSDRAQDESQADLEAIDWASAKTKRSQVDAEARKVQRQITAQLSVDHLLQFLDEVDRVDEPLSETDFMPQCLAHVQKVIKMIGVTYGQEKLQEVVGDECLQNEDYPLANADSFNKKQACQSLVEDLTRLRDQEVKTGSHKGYFDFCRRYVQNKDEDGLVAPYGLVMNGAKRQRQVSNSSDDKVTSKGSKSSALDGLYSTSANPSVPFIMLTLLASLCVVGVAFFSLRQGS